MKSERDQMVQAISSRLGKRSLYWFGIRGDDARSLMDINQFEGSFSIINRYSHAPLSYSVAYEDITGIRVDLDSWDIDLHLFDESTKEFRHLLLAAMGSANAIVTYRPSQFLSALTFAREDRCLYLGLYAGHQHVFEHKPWVETAVKNLGIPTLNWKYIADEDQIDAEELLKDGPIVVRPSRGSGGTGMAKVDGMDSLDVLWPHGDEFFASVSRFLDDCLPINVGAVVWDDGVTVHHPSIQLIGIAQSTRRQFGYCGNDFRLSAMLEPHIIDEVERKAVQIGNWLRSQGYRGAFGLDMMISQGTVLFTEINPRFQGSTRLSSRLDSLCEQSCILLDHIAAMLHVDAPIRPPLRETLIQAPPAAQLVLHNLADVPVKVSARLVLAAMEGVDPLTHMEICAGPGTEVAPNAVTAVFSFDHAITTTGYDLTPGLADAMAQAFLTMNGV